MLPVAVTGVERAPDILRHEVNSTRLVEGLKSVPEDGEC